MSNKTKKYIFITGGVSSSLGKGLAAASIAALLERRGIQINMLKMDPYINVDPGTMSPTQHGEVFVTDDGAETDLDLGHYERFSSLTLNKDNNFTTGQVYLQVIENEREGKYLGKTVQVVPHISDEIKRRIHVAASPCDLLIAEIGGTVGDIESLPFLESIRQFAQDVGSENVLFIHLVLVPYLQAAGELKTKPAQHSVKELRSIGLFPQVIICRSEHKLDEGILSKLAMFCNVSKGNVFHSMDVKSIYNLPLKFYEQGLDARITELLGIWTSRPQIDDLEKVVYNVNNPLKKVSVAIVGKYTELTESYKSLEEALRHGGIPTQTKVNINYIEADDIEENDKVLKDYDAILVPGGFGTRGTEGKIAAIRYARENKVPYFGICLGMQLAIIEYARHMANIKDATSDEFGRQGSPLIHYMDGQNKNMAKGGSMRLGAFDCTLVKGSFAQQLYKKNKISERHRHRLEVNNKYIKDLEKVGLKFSGMNEGLNLVEIIELENHPFFIACQFHPEFKSGPFSPHPLFKGFIEAAKEKKS